MLKHQGHNKVGDKLSQCFFFHLSGSYFGKDYKRMVQLWMDVFPCLQILQLQSLEIVHATVSYPTPVATSERSMCSNRLQQTLHSCQRNTYIQVVLITSPVKDITVASGFHICSDHSNSNTFIYTPPSSLWSSQKRILQGKKKKKNHKSGKGG